MHNPFAALSAAIPPVAMRVYVVVMFLLVVLGTLIDLVHKGSAKYFFKQRQNASFAATRAAGAGEVAGLVTHTVVVTVLAAGEFCGAWRTPHASAHDVRLHTLRRHHGSDGFRVSDCRGARAGDCARALVPRCRVDLHRRLLVLVAATGRCRGGRALAVAAGPRRPLHRLAARQRDLRAAVGLVADDRRSGVERGLLRSLSALQHGAVCLRAVVEVRPYVLQAGGGVSESASSRRTARAAICRPRPTFRRRSAASGVSRTTTEEHQRCLRLST